MTPETRAKLEREATASRLASRLSQGLYLHGEAWHRYASGVIVQELERIWTEAQREAVPATMQFALEAILAAEHLEDMRVEAQRERDERWREIAADQGNADGPASRATVREILRRVEEDTKP